MSELTVLETLAKHHSSGRGFEIDPEEPPPSEGTTVARLFATGIPAAPKDGNATAKQKKSESGAGSAVGAHSVTNRTHSMNMMEEGGYHETGAMTVTQEHPAALIEATLVKDQSERPQGDNDDDDKAEAIQVQAHPVNLEQDKRRRKRRMILLLCVFVVGAVGITVGGFCGTGACSSAGDDTESVTSAPTSPPLPKETYAPNTMPELVLQNLPAYTLEALKDPTSPQSLAHEWIANDPSLRLYSNDRLIQRFALVTLHMATEGDKWRDNEGWLSYERDECTWFNRVDFQWYPDYNSSVPCYENTTTYRYLTPWDNRMVGTIPKQVALLTSLINLDFSTSKLKGTIPTELGGGLTNLRKFFLNNNAEMVGSVPSEFGLMTLLDTLSLHDTALSGTLATELGKLTLLENFWMEFTSISGTIPSEVCALSNTSLFVEYSKLTCPVNEPCGGSCT